MSSNVELEQIQKGGGQQLFGDTTLTKVFVGGLAWETQNEELRNHFEKFGEILEAVIITDKATGRSKGYGFVTFKDAESAKKACEDSTPVINGRRSNCNLASLGARKSRASTLQSGSTATNNNHGNGGGGPQWYYPTGAGPLRYQHHRHQAEVLFHAYGYSPAYYTDVAYNPVKFGYNGSYLNGQHSQIYPAQAMMVPANTVVPVYPYIHFHQSQAMSDPTQLLPSNAAAPFTSRPGFVPKPLSMAPNTDIAVQQKVSVREA